VPGHDQSALLTELAASDAGAAVGEIPPFRLEFAGQPCAALESEFGTGNHLFKNSRWGWYASLWPSYQALEALSETALVSGGASCRTQFEDDVAAIDANYWDESLSSSVPAFDQGPNAFHVASDRPRVDDSLWMALAIMNDYSLTHDRVLLERAEGVFRLALSNWDPRRGGIYWEDHTEGTTNTYKSVVSNAPAVLLGAELFVQTGERSYLTRSEAIFRWLEANLRDRRTGLYDDGVADDRRGATVNSVKLTYNQGIVLGALSGLAEVDPSNFSPSDAVRFGIESMTYFAEHRSYGNPGFDAIWAENLLATSGLVDDPSFSRAARASVDAAVRAEPKGPSDLLDTASELALERLAALATGEYGALSAPLGDGP
jgi:Glycosyl hydrolase family 76